MYPIPEKTIAWLLNSQTPSIRYLTLSNILKKSVDHPLLIKESKLIQESSYIEEIFSKQDKKGFWFSDRHYYSPKYRSSHWTMSLLTELAIPPDYPPMQLGANFMLTRMENNSEGYHQIPSYFKEDVIGFCCFWGNWLRYQIYCGNHNHATVKKVIDFVCRDIHRSGQCKYNNNLPCAWGVIRSLYGLALIPAEDRSQQVHEAIDKGIRFVLEDYDLLNANYPNNGYIHAIWSKISFPLFARTDVLFSLRVLHELDVLSHPKAQSALEWLYSKQRNDGTWRGGSPFKSRSHSFLVEPDTPNHWITLLAATVFS